MRTNNGVNQFFKPSADVRLVYSWYKRAERMGQSLKSGLFLIESRIADAGHGDAEAYFELGVAYSCGSSGLTVDLVEAHKWFNLAALSGDERGQRMRAEIAGEMSAREIAEAQRQARAWLSSHTPLRRAA